jgi:hypothetical protein
MSNPLAAPQASAGLNGAPGPPALDLDEIQGDVLLGLQKFFERFLFFEIADVIAFKAALRTQLAPRVRHHPQAGGLMNGAASKAVAPTCRFSK